MIPLTQPSIGVARPEMGARAVLTALQHVGGAALRSRRSATH